MNRIFIFFSIVFLAPNLANAENLFKFNKKTYKASDLDPRFQQSAFQAEMSRFKILEKTINDAILDLHFKELAKKQGKSITEVIAKEIKVPTPTEKEIKDFYQENRSKLPYPFENIKGELIRFVSDNNRQKIRNAIITKLKKSGQFQSLIKQPLPPKLKIVTAGYPSKGSKSAKVTVVEFADYKCPHCKEAAHAFENILKKYKSKIHYVFIDFPIIGDSATIAEGAFCANKQNKYWEFHKKAYDEQGKLKSAEAIAKATGIDIKKFSLCMTKREGKAFVDKAKAEGVRVGVTGTPTIFINGYRLTEGYTEKDITMAIKKALAKAAS